MKRLLTLLAVYCSLLSMSVFAQYMANDSIIKILPYFQKGDTVVYDFYELNQVVDGADTIKVMEAQSKFQVVCLEADDNVGYRLEETYLEAEMDGSIVDMLKSMSMYEALQAFVGQSFYFICDPYGRNIQLENVHQVQKQLIDLYSAAYDSMAVKNPSVRFNMPKEQFLAQYDDRLSPDKIMENFEEMTRLFEYHGNAYLRDSVQTVILDSTAVNTRPGYVQVLAKAEPNEGQAPEDFCPYNLRVVGKIFYKPNPAKTKAEEIVLVEDYDNTYFSLGWPMDTKYIKLQMESETKYQMDVRVITYDTLVIGE